jgi:type IV pilus assembly protein PilM
MKLPFGNFKSKTLFGLDIGSSSVKAVELKLSAKGFELLHVGVAALPHEAIVQGAFLNASAIAEAIREAVASAKIKSSNVAVAVSGHAVIVKKISLPTMTREELEESIRWEAEQYIPFDVNEVNLDFQILNAGAIEGQMDVLLVAAKKDLIDDYVNVLSEAGMTPGVIDVAGFAVANAWAANADTAPDEVIAVANIGAQSTNINVLAGGIPAFTRDISIGGNAYTEEIQKVLSISFDEAERIKLGGSREEDSQDVVPQEVEAAMRNVSDSVIGEISRSLDFFSATSAESRISKVFLAGGSSKVSGFDKRFEEKSGIRVERLNPLARMLPSSIYESEFVSEMAPFLGVSVGLALREGSKR